MLDNTKATLRLSSDRSTPGATRDLNVAHKGAQINFGDVPLPPNSLFASSNQQKQPMKKERDNSPQQLPFEQVQTRRYRRTGLLSQSYDAGLPSKNLWQPVMAVPPEGYQSPKPEHPMKSVMKVRHFEEPLDQQRMKQKICGDTSQFFIEERLPMRHFLIGSKRVQVPVETAKSLQAKFERVTSMAYNLHEIK